MLVQGVTHQNIHTTFFLYSAFTRAVGVTELRQASRSAQSKETYALSNHKESINDLRQTIYTVLFNNE